MPDCKYGEAIVLVPSGQLTPSTKPHVASYAFFPKDCTITKNNLVPLFFRETATQTDCAMGFNDVYKSWTINISKGKKNNERKKCPDQSSCRDLGCVWSRSDGLMHGENYRGLTGSDTIDRCL